MRLQPLLPLLLLLSAPLAAVPSGAPRSVRSGSAYPGTETAVSARLDLQRGRALLVGGSGVVAVKRRTGPYVISGPGHLELAPGARARVFWPGQASLILHGPASFAWRGEGGERFWWTFTSLNRAEVEIRTREARVDLPDAWRVRLGRGAYSLHSLPGGGSELEHRAGEAAQASWLGGEGVSPPPVPVGPGECARLAGVPQFESVPDHTAGARRWDASSWPWGDGGIPDVPAELLPGDRPPWVNDDWPWNDPPLEVEAWERWDWPWWAPEEAPLEEPVTPRTPESPPRPAPDRVEETEPERDSPVEAGSDSEAPVAGTEEPSFVHDPELWRGLPAARLESHRGFRLQRSPDWSIEELPSGRTRIRLDRDTLDPAWYLGPKLDYRLFPGSELILEPDGRVRFHTGWIRILAATPGREFQG